MDPGFRNLWKSQANFVFLSKDRKFLQTSFVSIDKCLETCGKPLIFLWKTMGKSCIELGVDRGNPNQV